MDTANVLTGSGLVSLVLAIAYAIKMLVEWRKASPLRKYATMAVSDAHTANAVLTTTLDAIQDENNRLVKRVKYLEDANDAKDAKIEDLERRLNEIANELAGLKTIK